MSDICILIPSRAVLPFLEKSPDAAGIEFRSEASSLVYSTQEVHDLLDHLPGTPPTRRPSPAAPCVPRCSGAATTTCCAGEKRAASGSFTSTRRKDRRIFTGRARSPSAQVAARLGDLNLATWPVAAVADRQVFEVSMDSPRHRRGGGRLVIDQAHAWYAEDRGSLRDYLDWAATQACRERPRCRRGRAPRDQESRCAS